MKFLKNLSFHSVIISLVLQSVVNSMVFVMPAFADEPAPLNTTPEITPEDPNIHVYEQNNTNVIEIVEQNGSGLSHNKFTDYNAITKDQVINNSSSGGNSALAGTISGNSNFHNDSGSEASKILFEVKGSATMLQKDIEIFGNKQTDFILSNAKGIMCKGCGFINTSNNSSNPFNVSFIAGSVVDDGNPNNDINQFNIATNPDSVITIERNIVDNVNDDSRYGVKFYTNVTNFDLIARAVKIAGELKTANGKTLKNLNIQTGTGNFDYAKFSNNNDSDKKRVLGFDQNNIDTNQGNNLSEFSVIIDSTALGGARAGQISIIATEEGAGVKTDAELISNLEDVEITANGDIRVKKNIIANNNSNQLIKLTTTNLSNNLNNHHSITIENAANLNAKQDIIFDSKFDIETLGNLTAQNGRIDFDAANDINNSGLIEGNSLVSLNAKNITNKTNAIIEGNNISLTAAQSGKIINESNAKIQNQNNLAFILNLNNSDLENSGIIQATNSSLEIKNGKNINNKNSGSITAESDLTLKFSGLLTNKKTIQSTLGKLILEGTDSSSFTHEASTTFASGIGKAIDITIGTLINEAELDLKGGFLTLSDQTDQGLFNNALITSTIASADGLKITGRVTNYQNGQITSIDALTITGNITNSGKINTTNSNLNLTGKLDNESTGSIESNKSIILDSLSHQSVNSGLIATDKELQITGNLTNEKTIARIDDTAPLDVTNANDRKYLKILIKSGTLTNDVGGKILTNNYLVIDGNSEINPNNPAIYSGNLVNLGTIRSDNSSDVNNFDDNNAIEIKNINVLTNEGVIDSSEDLIITANEITNQNSGLLFASNNAILNVDKLTNNNANIITSFGDILIQKQIVETIDPNDANKTIKTFVKSSEVNNINNAQIKTLKTAIDAPLFDEFDIRRVLEQYAIEMLSTNNFSAEELTNRIYALRGFLKDSNLSIEEQIDQAITGNIKINTTTLTNDNHSIISSNNYIKIEADTINNNNDSVLASATYFDIITNNLKNQTGSQIYGATVLNIKAANENDVNNQISNSGLIRGSAVYLNTARLTNSNSQSANNTIESLFGQEFASTDYQFTNNNLFTIDGTGKFLITISDKVANSANNDEHLTNFLNAIGVDLSDPNNASIKLLGDDIYLSQFIANILNNHENSKSRYITFDATSDSKQLISFLDTTKAQMNKLGIEFGKKLSDEQRANLTDPFIAFEEKTITTKYLDGNSNNTDSNNLKTHTVYVPRIITPFETTINEETSQIANKTAAAIEARNEIIINATQEVRNNAQIKAGTIVIETANFTNELDNQILTIDENGNLKYVTKAPKIEAKNDIVITAKENFNNIGAEMIAGNALFVDAKNINISAAQSITNSNSYASGKKWAQAVDSQTITNTAFSSLTANNIILNSSNDINIIATSLTATNAIQIDAGNNLLITSAKDETTSTVRNWGRKGSFSQYQTNTVNKETNSSLNAGNIYLNSGNKLSVTGANINTKDLIATSLGQITFRGNNSKTTGTLALINDLKVLKPNSASTNSQNISLASSPDDPLDDPTGNPADDVINNSAADIVYEAGQGEHSTNDLVFMTSADIINHGYLLADGDISLSATNITNSKVATTQYYGHGFNTTLSGEALIKAGGDVLMQATNDINNYAGTIIAETGNITLLAGNNVNIGTMQERNFVHVGGKFQYHYDKTTNHGSEISAGNNIVIKAGNNATVQNSNSGNINITGSNLTSGTKTSATEGNIYLNAANDVNIKSSVDSLVTYGNSRKSSFYQASTTNNESNLTAGRNSNQGSIYINTFNIDENNQGQISIPPSIAAKDISNNIDITGSNLTAKDDVYLTANNDITIASAQDTYERIDRFKSKKRSSTTEINQTTQITSDITAQNGSIQINALGINGANSGDVEIVASNLTAADDLTIQAKENINLFSDIDSYYKKVETSKKGLTTRKSSTDIKASQHNVLSNLNAGNDLTLLTTNASNATSGIMIAGAKLNAGHDATLQSAGLIGVYAVQDYDYSYSHSQKSRNFSTIAKYTGASFAMKTIDKVSKALDAINPATYAGLNPIGSITRGMNSNLQNMAEGDFNSKSKTEIKEDYTYQLAEINAGNNVTLTADKNINLVGVSLTGLTGNVVSNNGDIVIANVKNSSYSYSETQKSKTTFSSVAATMVRNSLLATSNALVAPDLSKNPEKKKQILDENEEAMKEAMHKSETHIRESTDETIIASNLAFENDLNIIANSTNGTNGNITITSSNLSSNSGDVNIIAKKDIVINTAVENDSTFTLDEKKNPNVFAALSNGIVKLVKDTFPDLKPWEGPDKKKEDQRKAREDQSLGHKPHSKDFDVRTADKNLKDAMIEGYTISNNDADEMAYDLDLHKSTKRSSNNIESKILAGNNINIEAGNNINNEGDVLISASELIAQNNININAVFGQTTITSASDESFDALSTVDQDYNDLSINYNRGRISLDSESKVLEEDSKITAISQKSSELMAGNNININTKNDINILSSNLSANNQINLVSSHGNTNILANTNSTLTEKEIREGTMNLSVGLNHIAANAAYAADDVVKAGEALKDAKENLSEMKRLNKEGKADDEAVKDAEINLTIAILNVTLATMKMAASAQKLKGTWNTLGFYVDLQLTRTGQKTNITENSSDEVGSSLYAANDILINSGLSLTSPSSDLGNTNIKGSLISENGNISITSNNNTNITALKSTKSSNTKSEGFNQSVTLASSAGGDGFLENMIKSLAASIGVNKSKSDSSDTIYTNTAIEARNGTLEITSLNNTSIKGANLVASDLVLNTANNLDIQSLQNESFFKSKSQSANLGGGGNSIALGFNYSSDKFERNWVDDQTTLIGTNSVTINTGNNTNIKGALIANITNPEQSNQEDRIDGGNLLIDTGSLTFADIVDTEKQKSVAYGLQVSVSWSNDKKQDAKDQAKTNQQNNDNKNDGINPNSKNPNQDKDYYPGGSTRITAKNKGYEKEQITKATIGAGTIIVNGTTLASDDTTLVNLNRDVTNSQEITKDTITGALEIDTTIDNRLFIAGYQTLTNKTLTAEERASGKKLMSEILWGEQKDLGKGIINAPKTVKNSALDLFNNANLGIDYLGASTKDQKDLALAKIKTYNELRFNDQSVYLTPSQAKMIIKQAENAVKGIDNIDSAKSDTGPYPQIYLAGLALSALSTGALALLATKKVDFSQNGNITDRGVIQATWLVGDMLYKNLDDGATPQEQEQQFKEYKNYSPTDWSDSYTEEELAQVRERSKEGFDIHQGGLTINSTPIHNNQGNNTNTTYAPDDDDYYQDQGFEGTEQNGSGGFTDQGLSGAGDVPDMSVLNNDRPSFVPDGWIEKPSTKGGGVRYYNPENEHDQIRIMPGNPDSPNPAQREPYVKYYKQGQVVNSAGKPASNNSEESHIPLDKFNPDIIRK